MSDFSGKSENLAIMGHFAMWLQSQKLGRGHVFSSPICRKPIQPQLSFWRVPVDIFIISKNCSVFVFHTRPFATAGFESPGVAAPGGHFLPSSLLVVSFCSFVRDSSLFLKAI